MPSLLAGLLASLRFRSTLSPPPPDPSPPCRASAAHAAARPRRFDSPPSRSRGAATGAPLPCLLTELPRRSRPAPPPALPADSGDRDIRSWSLVRAAAPAAGGGGDHRDADGGGAAGGEGGKLAVPYREYWGDGGARLGGDAPWAVPGPAPVAPRSGPAWGAAAAGSAARRGAPARPRRRRRTPRRRLGDLGRQQGRLGRGRS
jgi:hypothetical protein